ncbi:MAG: hypothetical protein IT166_08875 [Bryobacterales bacterium]|nr:hypothetical protein [Bryobacterales bacterium]
MGLRSLSITLFASVLLAQLPEPQGRYTPARMTFVARDASRDEPLTADPTDRREFAVHVWYPCMPATGSQAQYLPDLSKWREALGDDLLLSALDGALEPAFRARPKVRAQGEVLHGRFPLLVFFPMPGASSLGYTTILSNLVSYGYIVVAIDPAYEVFATTLSEGRIAGFAAMGWFEPPESRISAFEADRVKVWTADAKFALDQMAASKLFLRSIDWRKAGALGHLTGAKAAMALTRQDSRVKLCLNLDGYPLDEDFPKPIAIIHEELREPVRPVPGLIYDILVRTSAMHMRSFLDFDVLNGRPGAEETMLLLSQYTAAYFDKVLRHKMGTVLDYKAVPGVERKQYESPEGR